MWVLYANLSLEEYFFKVRALSCPDPVNFQTRANRLFLSDGVMIPSILGAKTANLETLF